MCVEFNQASPKCPANLYVHFPFCRRRCSYCALYSRAGRSESERSEYAQRVASAVTSLGTGPSDFKTIYFGGGSPALCDLTPVLDALRCGQFPLIRGQPLEFTVELHPLDVTRDLLEKLKAGGVNRISMGVQSLDDEILAHMGRGYTFLEAERAFALIKSFFDNAGIDLIVGYPGEKRAILPQHARLSDWGLRHCSVYSLQNERRLVNVVDDETTLNRISETAEFLRGIGLERYEISNYAVPGFECRHNLAVWRGEDYIGIGDGACGRVGLRRMRNFWGLSPSNHGGLSPVEETVSEEFDEKERRLFRLRTKDGVDASGHPEWGQTLRRFVEEGLLTRDGDVYRLTARGTEVCDSILAELV